MECKEKFKNFVKSMDFDGKRTYCDLDCPGSWKLVKDTAVLPLNGWTLNDIEEYIIPYMPEDGAYFEKNMLVVNLNYID